MAGLTLGGIDVRVLQPNWAQQPSIYQGARVRARGGNLISTESDEKRVYEGTIDLYDAIEDAAIRAACPRGVAVAIDGDLVTTPFDGVVDIGSTQYSLVTVNGTDMLLRTAQIHIEEA